MKNLISYIQEHLKTPKDCKAFTIIKPGFLQYEQEIYSYILSKGFIMIDHTNPMKMSLSQIHKLYDCHSKETWYNDLCEYMASGEICAAIWDFDFEKYPGVNTIKLMKDIKHHFRDKYGKDDMRNCMHSSDSLEHVQREAKIIFN